MVMLTPMEIQEWIKVNIKDPLPMDNKSRLYEYLDVLSDDDTPIAYKDFALKGLGILSIKYSASPIILCGGLQLIKQQILSTNTILISQSVRTLSMIAKYGGEEDIKEEGLNDLI